MSIITPVRIDPILPSIPDEEIYEDEEEDCEKRSLTKSLRELMAIVKYAEVGQPSQWPSTTASLRVAAEKTK